MMEYDLFSGIPPHQRHSPTSRAAAEQALPRLNQQQERVFNFLKQCGDWGATDIEIQNVLKMAESTERPRRRELELQGFIKKSGETRATPSGRQAAVWVVV